MTNILLRSSEYYVDNFRRKSDLMSEYKQNMFTYLRMDFPELSDGELKQHIDEIVREQYKPRQLKYLQLPTPGNVNIKTNNLLEITNALNDDILTPYGSTYVSTTVRKAFTSDYIEDNQKERKIVKKDMFLADQRGDIATVRTKDLKQKNIKIGINALSGVMLSNVSFRSAINYNAITATARFCIMTSYAVVELALGNNYYFYNVDKAINWIINLIRIYPGDAQIKGCIDKYKLDVVDSKEVLFAYQEQVYKYDAFAKMDELKFLIDHLSTYQLCFIFYAMNLKRIFQHNDNFRSFFDSIINIAEYPELSGDVPKVAKLPDDIIQMLAVINRSDVIGKLTLQDIDAEHPDIARKLYSAYIHIENKFSDVADIFNTFITIPIIPSDIGSHKNMMRETVLISDTDSILFTCINWINWFYKRIIISDEAMRLNATIVSIISKLLDHVFAYISASMNIDLDNLRVLAIKNEFMYDAFLRTPLSKHYAGYVRYQEGVRKDPYKFDLKGKNFKGSDLSKETTKYVKWFIQYIFDSFIATYTIDPDDLIMKAIAFEQRIKKSIDDGQVTFLSPKPINLRINYKKPESSNYLYYELWQAVFAEKYGDINLPQKTKDLPITQVSFKDYRSISQIQTIDISLYKRFVDFMSKYPKKKFERVLIPMDIDIPEELRAVANYRKVCSANCYSLILILRSLNITNYPKSKNNIILFSDTYLELATYVNDMYQANLLESVNEKIIVVDDDEDFYDDEDDDEFFAGDIFYEEGGE